MLKCQGLLILLGALLASVLGAPPSPAADKDSSKEVTRVAGILFDKTDKFLTVKADREDEPVKYLIPTDDKKLTQDLKNIFNAARVQITYKKEGDDRQLVSIKKQVLRTTGTITGTVVAVHNNFWVEVKPKDGVADAYAPGANFKDKDFMDRLRGLKAGDSVTIRFTTDYERHRIVSLKKN